MGVIARLLLASMWGVGVAVVVVVGGSQLLKSLWLVVRAADGGANFVNFGGYFVAVALPFVSVH